MYFHLKEECSFVRGVSGSAVYHLKTGEIVHMTQAETEDIHKYLNGHPYEKHTSDGPAEALVGMGWGFFSEKACFVDRMRPYNDFTLLRPELNPAVLKTVFLQLNDKCRFGEKVCGSMFCAPCRCGNSAGAELTVKQWKKILDYLKQAGAEHVIFTGGSTALCPYLTELVQYTYSLDMQVSILVNSGELPPDLPVESVPIIVQICDGSEEADILESLKEFKNVSVLYHGGLPSAPDQARFHVQNVYLKPRKIERERMMPCKMERFYDRRDFDSCLKGTLYIRSDGMVVSCFQGNEPVGSLLEEDFAAVYRRLIKNVWNKKETQGKCHTCEWFYACPSCRYTDVGRLCGYDPAACVWQEEPR